MPHAQVYFNAKEFEEVELFLITKITKKNGKWTKQKLLKKAVLSYIRKKEDIIQPL